MKILTPLSQPVCMESRDGVQKHRKTNNLFGSDVIPFVAMPHRQLAAINLHDTILVPHCLPKGLLHFGHLFRLESFGQCLLVFCLHSAFKSCQCWTLKEREYSELTPRKVGLYRLGFFVLSLLTTKSDFKRTNQCSHRKMQEWYSKLKNAYRQLVY